MLDLKGKWVLVTGASRGIGRLAATLMAEQGCNLLLQSRSIEHTAELEKEIKAKRKAQRKAFVANIDRLFKTEYRYSKSFEKKHVYTDGKAYINVDLTKCESPFSIYSYDNRIS